MQLVGQVEQDSFKISPLMSEMKEKLYLFEVT